MIRTIASLLALGFAFAIPAAAQDWPARPVRFIVPFPPGGTVDPLARLVGARLAEPLKQQFVVENRPGAGGSIGTAIAAKSPPDGYTFLFAFDSHAINPALRSLPFDTAKDLAPVMLVGTAPYAIATQAGKPWKSLTEVVSASKAKPGSVTVGSLGAGTLAHLILMQMQRIGGFEATHVPYAGGGPMTTSILGGQIDLGIGSVALLTPHVRGGKMRALATTGERRATTLPEVPTLAEQGIGGLTAHAWWGIFAPAGTPKPILDRFHAELVRVFSLPEVRKTLADSLGMDLIVSGPEELQKFLLAEMDRWGRVVREHHIKVD